MPKPEQPADDFGEIDFPDDLDDLVGKLDGSGESENSPGFTLPHNLFHFHKMKADSKASRRGIRQHIKPANAQEVIEHLPPEPGDRTHCILKGNFVLCDLIPAIIRHHGPADHLHVATLGLSAANAKTLVGLQMDGRIGGLTLVVSHYFQQVDRHKTFAEVAGILKDRAEIIIVRSHCKVICIPAGKNHFVIEGSANLRSSDNLEQMLIVNDQPTLEFHRDWIEKLKGDE